MMIQQAIEAAFPGVVVQGVSARSRTQFDVVCNGQLIFSREQAGRFPMPADVVPKLQQYFEKA